MALKVFRTPIGFHDAYVAAPSQKAALKAWGSDADLFARGVAEMVTDPALTAEPLARPGEVVRRLRGTVAEQLAAAPPVAPKTRAPVRASRQRSPAPAAAARPRPGRGEVDKAEAALAKAEEEQQAAERALAAEEAALAERRRMLRTDWQRQREQLEAARDAAEQLYAAALKRWQAGA